MKLVPLVVVLAAFVLLLSGCCPISRWPHASTVSAPMKELRFISSALHEADARCAAATDDEAELERCAHQYRELRAVLLTLEKE